MGLSASLNGHRVTRARVSIPKWGPWYAEVSLDGEHELTGRVDLAIADLNLSGTIVSGGPSQGRSMYRIVAGAGGWGKSIARKPYSNDAGVKVSTVLGDAAREAGETVVVEGSDRVGPAFTRKEGTASRVLQFIAPSAWYVDEAGVTRLGARAAGELVGKVTRLAPVDLARGKVVLAAESIATILPGIVVDGLTAVDVEHEITAEGVLRSTLWGAQGSQSGNTLDSMRTLIEQLDPGRAFRGTTEYRVDTRNGSRLNLQPVRVSTGMPELKNVSVRPGVAGCEAEVALASRVLVSFIDADPARPYVVAFEDADGDGFQPTTLSLYAGGMSAGEHVMTTEATALLIYNTFVALFLAAGGGPLLGVVLQPLLGTAILAALTAQAVPAPPTAAAQAAAAAAQLSGFATGVAPATTSAFFTAAIAALSTKTANESGLFPSLGSKAVKAG